MARKILMIIPNLDFGGAQRVFYNYAQVLSEKFEVVECAFNLDNGRAFASENRLILLDVPGGKNFIYKTVFFIKRCWKFYKVKKKEQPDITISHLEGADYVNILSPGPGKKVLVVHGSKVHDEEMGGILGWWRKRFLIPLLYRQADLILTVSEGIKEELVSKFDLLPNRLIVLYNFFSIDRLKFLAAEKVSVTFCEENRKYKLLCSGRLAEPKNLKSLLYIVSFLKKERFPVQLLVIGGGALKEELYLTCKVLSLNYQELSLGNDQIEVDSDVVFFGYQNNPFKYYKLAQLFLMPSMWEGFPMALGEAMALGMPVVCSDCPPSGPLELLDPNWKRAYPLKSYPHFSPNGVLLPIPYYDKEETLKVWTITIKEVLSNPTLLKRIGDSAKSRMDSFSQEKMSEKLKSIDTILYD